MLWVATILAREGECGRLLACVRARTRRGDDEDTTSARCSSGGVIKTKEKLASSFSTCERAL